MINKPNQAQEGAKEEEKIETEREREREREREKAQPSPIRRKGENKERKI
jgi:hypothetical protein